MPPDPEGVRTMALMYRVTVRVSKSGTESAEVEDSVYSHRRNKVERTVKETVINVEADRDTQDEAVSLAQRVLATLEEPEES